MFPFLLVRKILSHNYAPTLPEIILLLSFSSSSDRPSEIDSLPRCSMSNTRLVAKLPRKTKKYEIHLNIKTKVHHIAIPYYIFLPL
jgi:hypothetical protein